MSIPSRGVVYVATGEQYVQEAADSARSVREKGGDYPICLITDAASAEGTDRTFWDHLIVLETPAYRSTDKMEMMRAPYDHLLFLDTDTQVLADLGEVFEVLNEFDLAAHQTPFGTWYDLPGVPKSFPEFNSGVIVLKKNEATRELIESWRTWYDKLHSIGRFDQISFRKAIYHSRVRYAWLPAEFNFMPYMPTRSARPLQIAHARGGREQMIREMGEASVGWHAWFPRLGLIPDRNTATLPQLLRLLARTHKLVAIEVAKRGLHLPAGIKTPRTVADAYRAYWDQLVRRIRQSPKE